MSFESMDPARTTNGSVILVNKYRILLNSLRIVFLCLTRVPIFTDGFSLLPQTLIAHAQQALEMNEIEVNHTERCLPWLSPFRHEQQENRTSREWEKKKSMIPAKFLERPFQLENSI